MQHIFYLPHSLSPLLEFGLQTDNAAALFEQLSFPQIVSCLGYIVLGGLLLVVFHSPTDPPFLPVLQRTIVTEIPSCWGLRLAAAIFLLPFTHPFIHRRQKTVGSLWNGLTPIFWIVAAGNLTIGTGGYSTTAC